MSKRSIAILGCLTLLALAPIPARAVLIFNAFLDGSQEVDPTGSPGTGFSELVLNDAETQALISLTFSGLVAPEIAAHIHGPAPVGVDADVIFPLPLGDFTNIVWNLTAEDVTNLKAGLLYINVHSSQFPGGEIRGQYALIPEPTTLALLGLGLSGIGWLRRKRSIAD